MSRRPMERARPAGRRARDRKPRAKIGVPGLGWWLLGLAVAAAVGGGWLWARARRPLTQQPPLSVAALTDSLSAAELRGDWARTLYWARRLDAAEPNDPALLLALGMVWNNYSYAWTTEGRVRPLARTSLERIEMESNALAFIDSAAGQTNRDDLWAEAMIQGGQVRENLGLPCEALQRYSAVQERLPNRPSVLSRLVFVERSLQAPLTIPSGTWAVRNR